MKMSSYQMLLVLLINHILEADLSHSVCATKRSTLYKGKLIYYTQYSCCQNFEERRGKCFECEIGFTALYGGGCQRCPANKFGKKCTSSCFCSGNERCDNINGCVSSMFYSNTTETYNTLNANTSSDILTVSMNVVEQNNKKDNIPILTVCIGSVSLILIITGIICHVRRRRRQLISNKLKQNIFQGNSIEQPQHEHAYDEIDEQNMCDYPINEFEYRPKENLNKTCESERTNTLIRKNDGYLHPCYCLTKYTGKTGRVSCSKSDEVSLESSTSEDDQGYQKVAQSSTQETRNFKHSVKYFEPLDVSTDNTHHLKTCKQDEHRSQLANNEYKACNCSNENDINSELGDHENIQLRDNVVSEGELNIIPNVFSFC